MSRIIFLLLLLFYYYYCFFCLTTIWVRHFSWKTNEMKKKICLIFVCTLCVHFTCWLCEWVFLGIFDISSILWLRFITWFSYVFFRCYCSRCLLSLFCFVQKVCKWLHNTRYSYTFCIFLIILCFFSLKSNIAYQKLNNLSHILFYFTVVVNVAIFVISILLFSCHTSLLYLSFIRRTRFFLYESNEIETRNRKSHFFILYLFLLMYLSFVAKRKDRY